VENKHVLNALLCDVWAGQQTSQDCYYSSVFSAFSIDAHTRATVDESFLQSELQFGANNTFWKEEAQTWTTPRKMADGVRIQEDKDICKCLFNGCNLS
jgi:hypothetical protein